MTFNQFSIICEDKRYRKLIKDGQCIGIRETETSNVLLFQLRNTYAEVYFDKEKESLACTRYFSSTSELEPYLAEIDIHHLLAI